MRKLMEAVRTCAVAAVVVAVAGTFYWYFLRPKAPRLKFETTHVQMGVISNKAPTSVKLPFHNEGRGRLKVQGITTSCSCTSASASPHELTPGEKGTLTITIDPAKFGGFESDKVVAVDTNDGVAKITASFLIDPEFEVRPLELDFGKVAKGSEAVINVHMRQLGDEPVTVKGLAPYATAAPGLFSMTCVPVPAEKWASPGKAEFALRLAVSPDAPSGPFKTHIGIEQPCSRLRAFWLPATGDVVAPYVLDPHEVLLGRRRHGDSVPNIARITADMAISVTDLKCGIAELSLTCVPNASGNGVQFDAQVVDSAQADLYEGYADFVVHVGEKAYPDSFRLRVRVIEPEGESPASRK